MGGFQVVGDLTYEDYDGKVTVTVELCPLCYALTTYPSAHMEWHRLRDPQEYLTRPFAD